MCHWGFNGAILSGRQSRFYTAYDLFVASDVLKHADIDEDLLIDMNDSGLSFDENADYLDRIDLLVYPQSLLLTYRVHIKTHVCTFKFTWS